MLQEVDDREGLREGLHQGVLQEGLTSAISAQPGGVRKPAGIGRRLLRQLLHDGYGE
jgi:hypothetical protein